MENEQSFGEIVTLVIRAVALALAVAVIVLNILNVLPIETQMLFLGFSLFGLAITTIDSGRHHEQPSH